MEKQLIPSVGSIAQSANKLSGIAIKEIRKEKDSYKIILHISCSSQIHDAKIFLNYMILVELPYSYPKILPICYEYGEKKIRSYHHLNHDKVGSFCLGTEIELRYRLFPDYSISKYFELIIEYLTVYSYYKKYHTMPVSERSHGRKGILEGYQHILKVKNTGILLDLLSVLPVKNKDKNLLCPCGSGKKIKKCHYCELLKITKSKLLYNQAKRDLTILKDGRKYEYNLFRTK